LNNLRIIIETRFALILLASCLAGLLLPGADRIPSLFVSISLATITFLSFFRASWQDVRNVSIWRLVLFYVARFLILPVILYLLSEIVIPAFSSSVFLLTLLPSGVMSTPISMMLSGNVTLNFIVLISSTLLTPFTLPALFETFGGSTFQVDSAAVFRSLLFLLLLPFLLHIPFRRVNFISNRIKQYGGAISIIIVASIMIAVVGKERNVIYRNPIMVVEAVVISVLVYLILHAGGWYLAFSSQREDKIALSVASGVNQLGLGIGLAFLHFPSITSIFMVSSNFAWVATIALSKWRIGSGGSLPGEERE